MVEQENKTKPNNKTVYFILSF